MSSTAPLKATSPAKVILFGEHAVVYGQPALAVPVASLRATALIEPSEQFRILAVDTGRSVSLDALAEMVDDALWRMAKLTLDFFHAEPPKVTITLTSQIPPASGLGSGAAVSAALGRAVALAVGKTISQDELNPLVYEVERIYHGTPSGIDNTVIVYEQPVFFMREHPIERLSIKAPFGLIIADTGKASLTKVAVGDVRTLYDADRVRIQPLLERIGQVSRAARTALESGEIETLGRLMNENHELLQQLTVSSPELDALVSAARDADALGAKLSGGGRGGNMIALVDETTRQAVQDALIKAGAARVLFTLVQ